MEFNAQLKDKKPSAPDLFGLFFEDINHSLDGGLNANLVQNGWFDFSYFTYDRPRVTHENDFLRFWEVDKSASICSREKISKNRPNSLHIVSKRSAIFKNLGYDISHGKRAMFLVVGGYDGSFYYKSKTAARVIVFVEGEGGRKDLKTLELKQSAEFERVSYKILINKSGYYKLGFEVVGEANIRFVGFKLINEEYFRGKNNYPYGKFKPSLVESLNMGAKFLRFPGGCLVEGDVSTDYLYNWENTIGEEKDRKSLPSVWGYLQSNEIGFYEYFCLCEELGLSPVPVHHVGVVCEIRTEVTRHEGFLRLLPSTKEFKERVIASVAHLIYFARGDAQSADPEEREFAQKRVEMGHKKPFNLKYVALGNENWGDAYFENFEACLSGIKNYKYNGRATDLVEKFGLTILSSSGVDINPQDTNPSWRYLNKTHSELIVDEHVYNTPEWFIDSYNRYDFYNKNLSKVFMGEYACHTDADGFGKLGGENNFTAALSEAVFMLGMENNPEIVKLSCYAPLFNRINQPNWLPDLIHFDEHGERFTPSYYVQKFFMNTHLKNTIKLEYPKSPVRGKIELTAKNGSAKIEALESLSGEKLKIDSGLDYENCVVKLGLKHGADFVLTLGKTLEGGESAYKIICDARGEVFFEKLFHGKRMTKEYLGRIELGDSLKVKFLADKIVVCSASGELIKNIWKTDEKLFAGLTYDDKKVFIKVINISNKKESFSINLDEKLFLGKIELEKHVITEGAAGEINRKTERLKANKKLAGEVEPRSINLYILK